jgi:hypothetical protein
MGGGGGGTVGIRAGEGTHTAWEPRPLWEEREEREVLYSNVGRREKEGEVLKVTWEGGRGTAQ